MSGRRAFLQSGSLVLAGASAGCTLPGPGGGKDRSGSDETAGIVWDRRYEGARATRFLDIVAASTGGFLLVGFTTSHLDRPGQGIAIRTDDEGRERWRHTVTETTALLAATEGEDGEFVATTYRALGSGGTGDSGAVALADDGTERWRIPLSQSGQSQLWSVTHTADGSYVLGGADRDEGWLVRLEANGSVRTNRQPVLESVPLTFVTDIIPSDAGVTVVAAGGDAGTRDEWCALFELASDGSIEWGRRYDQQFGDVSATDDGYALLGRDSRPDPAPEVYLPPHPMLVTVAGDGSVTGSWTYGSPDEDHWFVEEALLRAPDGGFIVGGRYEPWEELGTRRGPVVMQTGLDAGSVAWARLYEDGDRVWALARAGDRSVFTSMVDDGRQARLAKFGPPRSSNVALETTTVAGPTSEPL